MNIIKLCVPIVISAELMQFSGGLQWGQLAVPVKNVRSETRQGRLKEKLVEICLKLSKIKFAIDEFAGQIVSDSFL